MSDSDLTKQHLRELVKKLDQALALSDTTVIEADTSVDYGTKDVPSANGMMLETKHDGLVTVTLRIKMLHGKDAPPLSAGRSQPSRLISNALCIDEISRL